MKTWIILCCACALLALPACGKPGLGSGSGSSLATGVAIAQAEWLVVDLASGTVTGMASVPGLTTDSAYRTSRMVFRRVPAANTTIGSAIGVTWRQADEVPTTTAVPEAFVGVFEVTRAQWQRLAGTTPWTAATPTILAGDPGDDQLPASGLSLEAINLALAGWRHRGRFAVPSEPLWERCARAGSTAAFPWGDATDEATVAGHAAVRQTVAAPQRPGGRLANALGLHDTAGNLWEWTTAATLRGGSWHDGLAMARCANRIELDPATPHALAGVRLVYIP